jgi:hypothetical protein
MLVKCRDGYGKCVKDLEVQKDFLIDVNKGIRKDKIKAGLIGFSIGAAVVTICIIPPVVLYLMKK